MSKKFSKSLFIVILLMTYFVYHLIGGHHGLLTWHDLDYQLSKAYDERKKLRLVKNSLEQRIFQICSGSPSYDLLTECTKDVLSYSEVGETIIKVQ